MERVARLLLAVADQCRITDFPLIKDINRNLTGINRLVTPADPRTML